METVTNAPARPVRNKNGKRWTRLEEQKLVRLYQTMDDYSEIATMIGRTRSAVTSRLQLLGYIRYDKPTDSLIRIK